MAIYLVRRADDPGVDVATALVVIANHEAEATQLASEERPELRGVRLTADRVPQAGLLHVLDSMGEG
ncbi:hypothetical protein OTB20_08530 [Streptomyces sp. H27-H1]|uniref:hypothetical protein n=1 Tax=Streptomyces sp. H27-H1 TaxID=2996461 RepID=UPI002271724D|nr:hypothetical protein [Streptomyces sp. H27-H1]MCY0926251.1 hypothetical protein [Streptomyces sp. H27-H1]